jgi:hypothetical protein
MIKIPGPQCASIVPCHNIFYIFIFINRSRYSDGLRAGRPGRDSRQGQDIVLFFTASRPALGPTHPPVHWVPGALSPGVKRLRHEAGNLPPSRAEIKNGGVIPSLPHMCSWNNA